jgi:polysaccharide export outer membrane protein
MDRTLDHTRLRRVAMVIGLCAAAAASAVAQQQSGRPLSATQVGMSRIAPGDDVIVVVAREPDLSAAVIVDERNEIALPRLGLINLTAHSPTSLRDTIRARYSVFLRDPVINVTALRRVAVNGAVTRPDVYLVDVTMNLRDIIARAGGLTSEADGKKVSILRGDQEISVSDWDRSTSAMLSLRSGDQIMVGRKPWVLLNLGQVIGAIGIAASLIYTVTR